jgi:hypothetical protein
MDLAIMSYSLLSVLCKCSYKKSSPPKSRLLSLSGASTNPLNWKHHDYMTTWLHVYMTTWLQPYTLAGSKGVGINRQKPIRRVEQVSVYWHRTGLAASASETVVLVVRGSAGGAWDSTASTAPHQLNQLMHKEVLGQQSRVLRFVGKFLFLIIQGWYDRQFTVYVWRDWLWRRQSQQSFNTLTPFNFLLLYECYMLA